MRFNFIIIHNNKQSFISEKLNALLISLVLSLSTPREARSGEVRVLHHLCSVVVGSPEGGVHLCGGPHPGKEHSG